MKQKHLDLFSGIGGFALAARWAGLETVQFVEIEPYAQKVLAKHWPNVHVHGDIRTFDGKPFAGEVFLLTGGFPCQPFSVAGKRGGTSDNRFLWPEMLRVIGEVRPKFVLAENVPGLISQGGGWFSTDVLLTWKIKATKSNRFLFQLAVSVPRINGSGCGLWLTPRAQETNERPESFVRRNGDRSAKCCGSLSSQIANPHLWPTKLLPTLVAQDSKNSTLPPSQEKWDSVPGALMRNGMKTGYRLRPVFAEWMMGYPRNWTLVRGLKDLETP